MKCEKCLQPLSPRNIGITELPSGKKEIWINCKKCNTKESIPMPAIQKSVFQRG
jgi:RNase P subunit RPR2